ISVDTSRRGRSQLSAENAYKVKTETCDSTAASTIFRTVSAPARCPAGRGSPLCTAHRPFPSMMIATCIDDSRSKSYFAAQSTCLIELATARRLDQRFHMTQIALEYPSPLRRQAVLGFRHTGRE